MLDNITIGKYYPGKSKIHFMAPLAKVICLVCYFLMVFLCFDLRLSFLLFLMVCVIIELAHIHPRIYWNTFNNLKFLILLMIIINFLLGFNLELLTLSILRLVSIVLYMVVLTLTTTPLELTTGLQKFLTPLKILGLPTNKIAFSLSLALRFIPLMLEQKNKILKTQASRGVDFFNSSLKDRFIAVKALIVPLFNLTLDKSDQIAHAMNIRLYDVNFRRTNFRIRKWNTTDTFFILAHFTLLLAVIGNEFIW